MTYDEAMNALMAAEERDSRFEAAGASLRADLAARLNGVVAEIAEANGTTQAEVLGTAIGFLRQAKEHRLAALTLKEDTSCRTA